MYASRLALAGAKVTAVDFSMRSIEYARQQAEKKSLDITYAVGDYLSCDFPSEIDIALLVFCDFCALSPDQRRLLLSRIRKSLKNGGRLIMDVFSESAFKKRSNSATYQRNALDGFFAAEAYWCFSTTFIYQEEMLVLDRHSVVTATSKVEYYNWLQHYTVEKITEELHSCGFHIIATHGNVAGDPATIDDAEIALVATAADTIGEFP